MRNESSKSSFPVKYLAYGSAKKILKEGLFAKWARQSLENVLPVPEIYITDVSNDRYHKYFNLIWTLETGKDAKETNTWISNGFRTIVVGLHLCDSMTIYGMDTGISCNEEQYQNVKVSEHNFGQRCFHF